MTAQTSVISAAVELLGGRPLHDFQRRACEALLASRDVLLVAPTGAGKSLCYQLITKITGRPTLVVSPLIALMDDQAAGSTRLALKAACLHSGIEARRQWATVASWMAGKLQILYTSPERLRDPRLLATLDTNRPGLIVIDEAHCISTWGQRFRPAYRKLGDLAHRFSGTPLLAMTATAKSAIQRDIADTLGLKGHVTVSEPLTLTQVTIKAVHAATDAERATILSDVARRDDLFPMVIFCVLKKHCEVVATLLRKLGLTAFVYHAGMPLEQRGDICKTFQANLGRKVLVATSAYEMGVNVPGIRAVIHYGLPASLESYVQGIGRAGRGGCPATAIILYGDADLDILDSLEGLGCDSSGPSDDLFNRAAQDVYAFAVTRACRKIFLRSYFHPELGSTDLFRCGRCDNCDRLGSFTERLSNEVATAAAALRQWRKQTAAAAGKPAFAIFTNRELARLAAHRPLTVVELANIAGIRRVSVDRYGTELIELIRALR